MLLLIAYNFSLLRRKIGSYIFQMGQMDQDKAMFWGGEYETDVQLLNQRRNVAVGGKILTGGAMAGSSMIQTRGNKLSPLNTAQSTLVLPLFEYRITSGVPAFSKYAAKF